MTGAVGAVDWALITTLAEAPETHPSEFATVKVYVPAVRPEIVAAVPVPVTITPPGLRVNVQTPVGGKPLSSALPVGSRHVGWVITPTCGATGPPLTLSVYSAVAAAHGVPSGLFVVTVMITVCPASPVAGLYVNANGWLTAEPGVTIPAPFSVIDTLVALPPKILPLTVTGNVLQVLPLLLLRVTVGGLTHPHDTMKADPAVVHPDEFFTVIVCVPLATLEKETLSWYAPPSRQ